MFSVKFVLVIILFIIAFISFFIGYVKLKKAKKDFNKIDKSSLKVERFSYNIALQNDNPKILSKIEYVSKIILSLIIMFLIVMGVALMSLYIMFEYKDSTFSMIALCLGTLILTISLYFSNKLLYLRKEALDSFFEEKDKSSKEILEKQLDYSKEHLISMIFIDIFLIIVTLIPLIPVVLKTINIVLI